jgi:steroid 5-alpha reductase family enzyme
MATLSLGEYDAFYTVLTIFAAFRRILPPLVRWPPPPLVEFYDTYIGLTPIVSHFVLHLLSLPLQLVIGLGLSGSGLLGASDVACSLLSICVAVLYTVHAPLSSDRRTDRLPDARLCVMCLIVVLWALQRLTVSLSSRLAQYRRMRSYCRLPTVAVLSLVGTVSKTFELFFLLAPFYFAWNARSKPSSDSLSGIDLACAAMAFGCLFVKQLCHSEEKRAVVSNPGQGFATTGMYAWMRRPVEVTELLFWCSVFGFAARCAGSVSVWPLAGPVLYAWNLLFWTLFDEAAFARVSPQYRSVRWMFLPLSREFTPAPENVETKKDK